MLDKPTRAIAIKERDLKPPRPVSDIHLVKFSNNDTFKSARGSWMRDLTRMGHPGFANMIAVCFVASGYMGFAKGAVCIADQNRLAADLGWGLSTVRRALKLAEAWGWLVKDRRPLSTNEYRMSYSPAVLATIELEHANRIAEFEVEAAKKRLTRGALRSFNLGRKETSDLTEPVVQPRTNHSSNLERLSSPISSEADPHQQSTERLGEGGPDIEGDQVVQKKADRDDVIRALGLGDFEEGEELAAYIAPGRIAFIVQEAETRGLRAVADDIRRAAADADELRERRAAS